MKVIKISIHNDEIIVSKEKTKDNVNTNKFQNDSLFYTNTFLRVNKDKIRDIINTISYNSVTFLDFETFIIAYDLFYITNINFDINKSLTPKVMNILYELKYLKKINCSFMPSDYVHKFAKKGISIEFSNNIKFDMEFISSNNFKNLKSIYYKKIVNFNSEKEVFNNLESFLSVNSSLKYIYLYCYSLDIIKFIVSSLEKYKLDDVSILIYQSNIDEKALIKDTNELRKINKKYSNKKREIKIIYSNEFFKNNIFRELTINGLKLSMIIILYVGIVFIISDKYHEYKSLLKLRMLEATLIEEQITAIDEIDDTEIEHPVEVPVEEEEEDINYYANVPTNFDSLLRINGDVIGWLNVNNTKVNYPVTHTNDNSYYLNHDIYGNQTIVGWIYMDHRNRIDNLSKNTIIYGHNLTTGYMFGDLKNTTNYNWYSKPENQIITFNTLNRNMKWKIFAMYRTDYTNDYLTTHFISDEEFTNFINMVKGRSITDFNVNVTKDDYILTLSTCTGSNNRRLAIHAVLIN